MTRKQMLAQARAVYEALAAVEAAIGQVRTHGQAESKAANELFTTEVQRLMMTQPRNARVSRNEVELGVQARLADQLKRDLRAKAGHLAREIRARHETAKGLLTRARDDARRIRLEEITGTDQTSLLRSIQQQLAVQNARAEAAEMDIDDLLAGLTEAQASGGRERAYIYDARLTKLLAEDITPTTNDVRGITLAKQARAAQRARLDSLREARVPESVRKLEDVAGTWFATLDRHVSGAYRNAMILAETGDSMVAHPAIQKSEETAQAALVELHQHFDATLGAAAADTTLAA